MPEPSPPVSVVIPYYNSAQLITKHLPAVITALRDGDELIVIDDASPDETWATLLRRFHLKAVATGEELRQDERGSYSLFEATWQSGRRQGVVKLLRNHENLRFAATCNRAVRHATREFVCLLNSDVSPKPTTLSAALPLMNDEHVFGVGFLEEEDKTRHPVVGGKNRLWFQRGMFHHERTSPATTGETAWVSGGSGIFRRSMWEQLRGFDEAYAPAYWEDMDLSRRAQRCGWKTVFSAEAVVYHRHETTNQSAFSRGAVTTMSWRNAKRFTWHHANWWQRLQFLFWQPYWWWKAKDLAAVTIIGIALLVGILALSRLWQLGKVPAGLAWDEAAIGYNGFGIWQTRRDEWLNRLPLSFRSFGDYKAPLAIYLNAFFTSAFGVTPFAIRFPFALASIMTALGMAILTWLVVRRVVPRQYREAVITIALIQALLSPPLLHYGRIAFESGLALCFIVWAAVIGIATLQRRRQPWVVEKLFALQTLAGMVIAGGLVAASLYTYHSPKLFVPAFVVVMVAMAVLRREWLRLKMIGAAAVVALVALLPLMWNTVRGHGGERLTQGSVLGLPISWIEKIMMVWQQFWPHFTLAYLIFGQTTSFRHGDGKWGILLPTTLGLCVIGGVGLLYWGVQWWQSADRYRRQRAEYLVLAIFWAVMWIVIGTLPAAVGREAPHSNRALLSLPGYLLLAVLGGVTLVEWIAKTRWAKSWSGSHGERQLFAKSVMGTIVMVHVIFGVAMMNDYFVRFPKVASADFSEGYFAALTIARQEEPRVDKILFTAAYGQPYIYALIARHTTPIGFHGGSLIKYEFSEHINFGDLGRKNALIIATPKEIPPDRAQRFIYGSDGAIRFVIVKTPAD